MYKVYLSQETKERLITISLPIPPEDIELKLDVDNIGYNVLQIGEVIKPGDKKLKKFDIKSYLPANKDPEVFIEVIEKMIENKLPIRFVINRRDKNKLLFDMNIEVVIDNFTYKENGGEIGDIYYTLKFTEYKEFKAKVINGV